MTIFLLEDDENIRKLVLYALQGAGFTTAGFELPSRLYEALKKETPSLLLLDIMLPEEDGLCVLSKLRREEKTKDLPIILLTAKNTEYDKVTGLDRGADDYIPKPFGIMELISRVRALLRRCGEEEKKPEEYTLGGVCINPLKHTVTADGVPVTLTVKEFDLLLLLVKNPETVFSRDQLFQKIWGYDFDGENRTLDVHIRTLRRALGKCGDIIGTVRGIGYKAGMTK